MLRTVRVRDRMRPGAVAVAWSDSADVALTRMQDARLGAIPVVNDQRVIGLLGSVGRNGRKTTLTQGLLGMSRRRAVTSRSRASFPAGQR